MDLGDPGLELGSFYIFDYLAIPESSSKGNELPLLDGLRELREILPSIYVMLFGAILVDAMSFFQFFISDGEDNGLTLTLTAVPMVLCQPRKEVEKDYSELCALLNVRAYDHASQIPEMGLSLTDLVKLMFATMHGLIALKASGRMHAEKGLTGVESSLQLLVDLLSPRSK